MRGYKPSRAKLIASSLDSHVFAVQGYFENKPSEPVTDGDKVVIRTFIGYVLLASTMLVELADAYEKSINDCASALKAAEEPVDGGDDVINLNPVWLALEASPGFESPYDTKGD